MQHYIVCHMQTHDVLTIYHMQTHDMSCVICNTHTRHMKCITRGGNGMFRDNRRKRVQYQSPLRACISPRVRQMYNNMQHRTQGYVLYIPPSADVQQYVAQNKRLCVIEQKVMCYIFHLKQMYNNMQHRTKDYVLQNKKLCVMLAQNKRLYVIYSTLSIYTHISL